MSSLKFESKKLLSSDEYPNFVNKKNGVVNDSPVELQVIKEMCQVVSPIKLLRIKVTPKSVSQNSF